jgi:succinate-semialdehyde dehydrogenase / glutarate-semialdehyde dehydrogenase
MAIATVNPATGKTEKTFDPHDESTVDKALEASAAAFSDFSRTTFQDRSRLMTSAADLFDAEAPDIARIMTTEMGKTYAAAKGEVAKSANGLRWFAQHAESLLNDEVVETSASDSRAVYRALGPVLAVMPWNFPIWQVIRFAAPALMVGNTGLLKHASNVPQTALLIEDVFRRAGYPEGVFQTLLIESSRIAAVVADDRVKAVTLTGSDAAGRSVAEAAGRALKKTVLELGGSDPYIVLPSADLDRAVSVGVQARVQNNGQSCIAAKRFIVHEEVYEAFESAFVSAVSSLSVGDPMDPATDVGPLATESGRDGVAKQVADAREKGAEVLCGGRLIDSPGFFYEPTVLADLTPSMGVYREEVFGPVAMLYSARGNDEALRIANDSPFGLGASVWTKDPDERTQFVEGLETGMIFFNAMVASTPELPFGGLKQSGYGRELGDLGLREFCAIKTVWVN